MNAEFAAQVQISTLRELPVFRHLEEPVLQNLASSSRAVSFEPGQEILTPEGVVLVITQGEVSCFIHDAADKKFLLGTAAAGGVLGELSFLVSGAANEQKVKLQAVSTVDAVRLPTALFFEALTGNSAASLALLRGLAQRLAAMNRFARTVVDVDIDSAELHPHTFGEKMADWVSAKIGSWQFLLGGIAFTAIWTAVNGYVLTYGWDPYPFIFLNLVFSVVSASTLPVLLMSQNRQNQLDRFAARVNQRMTLRSTQLNARILKELRGIRRRLDG